MHADVESFLGELNSVAGEWSRKWCERVVGLDGTTLYVKTIYIGAEVEGEMFAALYPGRDRFELALAVSEDLPGPDLIDASHLTWPTMPLALVGTYESSGEVDWERILELCRTAHNRVAGGRHDVLRPAAFFQLRSEAQRAARLVAGLPDLRPHV